MGENQNLAPIKMERVEEGPSTSTRPNPPPPSTSYLSDGIKEAFAMELESNSAKISNLERHLALERNKYSELENFTYQSIRELIEMLGDMQSCLDVATRGGMCEKDQETETMVQFPRILNYLKENLWKMEERDNQAIRKELGVLWGVIRRIKLITGKAAIVALVIPPPPSPIEPMEIGLGDGSDDEVVFMKAVKKTGSANGCSRVPLASTSSEIRGPPAPPPGLESAILVTNAKAAAVTTGQYQVPPVREFPTVGAPCLDEDRNSDIRRSKRLTVQRKRGRPLGSTKRATCTICGKSFKNEAFFKTHQWRMHGTADNGNNNGSAVQVPLAPVPVAPNVGEAVSGTSVQAQVQAASESAGDPNNATCLCETCVKRRRLRD